MKELTPEYLEELAQTTNGFYSWDYVAGLATRVIELECQLKSKRIIIEGKEQTIREVVEKMLDLRRR